MSANDKHASRIFAEVGGIHYELLLSSPTMQPHDQ